MNKLCILYDCRIVSRFAGDANTGLRDSICIEESRIAILSRILYCEPKKTPLTRLCLWFSGLQRNYLLV